MYSAAFIKSNFGLHSNVSFTLTFTFIGPLTPFLVVTIITPLAAREPYIAAAEASFKIWIDSTSAGLKSTPGSVIIPSTTHNGALLLNEPTPRIWIEASSPALPLLRTFTPVASPCIWLTSVPAELFFISLVSTTATAPVRSDFFTVW